MRSKRTLLFLVACLGFVILPLVELAVAGGPLPSNSPAPTAPCSSANLIERVNELEARVSSLSAEIQSLREEIGKIREDTDGEKPAPGTVLWKKRIYPPGDKHGALSSSPALGEDNQIYITGRESATPFLYAFNPDGKLEWKKPGVRGEVVLDKKGRIHGETSDSGTVIRYSRRGKEIPFERPIRGNQLSIADDGSFYLNPARGEIWKVDPGDGIPYWKFKTSISQEKFGDGISIDAAGKIYFAGKSQRGRGRPRIYSFHPDGRLAWSYRFRGEARTLPAIGEEGSVYGVINFGGGLSNTNGTLVSFSEDGEEEWRFNTGSKVTHMNDATYRNFSYPVIGPSGNIYVGSTDNNLYAVTSGGELEWKANTGAPVKSTPAVGENGTLYVGNEAGELLAISAGGEKKWALSTGGRIHGSVNIGNNGVAYFTSWDGYLYAVQTASKGLAESPWPRYRGNSRQSGTINR
ncbi:MAG: PQQ-binding-like beta-propeller repeat protein [bacterium]